MTILDLPRTDQLLSGDGPLDVLLVGGAGWGNVGDDAIAMSLLARIGSAGHTVSLAGGPLVSDLKGFARYVVVGASPRNRLNLLSAIARSDIVLIGGGGLLNDRHANFHRPFTRVAAVCRILKRRYAFVAVGVGPICRASTARMIRAACQGALEIAVRDHGSRNALQAVGVAKLIHVTDDPAANYPYRPMSKTIDLCVNLRSWGTAQDRSTNVVTADVLVPLASVLNGLSPQPRVALLSMSANFDADEQPLRELQAMLTFPVETHFHSTVDEAVDVIARSHRVVAMRLHACLLAHACGVPAIGIAYDPKVREQGLRHGFGVMTLAEATSESDLLDALDTPTPKHSDGRFP